MYGYIRQGRRTALTRETIGGVPFWVLTAGQGRLRRRGVRSLPVSGKHYAHHRERSWRPDT